MIEFLNQNQSAIAAAAIVVLTAATLVYAWLTHILARETRLMRETASPPHIVAYLAQHKQTREAIDFVLANVGQGPAFNVTFSLVSGGGDFEEHGAHLHASEVPLAVLPQGERIKSFLGTTLELLAEPAVRSFTVEVVYMDVSGRSFSGEFTLDIEAHRFLRGVPNSLEKDTADAVRRIADRLDKWSSGRLPVEVMTAKENREERAAALAEARRIFEKYRPPTYKSDTPPET